MQCNIECMIDWGREMQTDVILREPPMDAPSGRARVEGAGGSYAHKYIKLIINVTHLTIYNTIILVRTVIKFLNKKKFRAFLKIIFSWVFKKADKKI